MQALAIAKLVGDGHTSKTAEQPLITVLDDSELGEESQPGVVFLPFLMQVASLCPRSVPNSLKPRLRAALDKILEEESEAAKLTSLILWTLSGDHHATLQFGCLHALVIAAQQITVEFGALELLANTVGPGALHNAATVVCSRDSVDVQKDDFAKGCSSSWMQLVFVLLIRLKKVPHRIRMRDVFGVALEGVRHCPSSGDPIDVAVRQSALKLLASLVGVAPRCFATLPMASFAQTTNALQSLAAMDPSRELRQLASTLSGALAETVEYTVRQ